MRQLEVMVKAKQEHDGELVAFHLRMIDLALMVPGTLGRLPELNPYRGEANESEAMKAHREAWKRAQWRGMTGG